jgi:hypothetical protein
MLLPYIWVLLLEPCTAYAFQVPAALSVPGSSVHPVSVLRLLQRSSTVTANDLPSRGTRGRTGVSSLQAGLFDNLFGGVTKDSTQAPANAKVVNIREKKPEWTELIDDASGKPYFWNELTGETSWVPPASVLQARLPDPDDNNLLSDEAYYAKITAEVDKAAGPAKDFGNIQPFPVMYDGWFAGEHEWMGADGETPKKVSGQVAKALGRQIEMQMIGAVEAALANGMTRMEVRFDPVPNLEEVYMHACMHA